MYASFEQRYYFVHMYMTLYMFDPFWNYTMLYCTVLTVYS